MIIELSFKLTFWTQIKIELSCLHFQLNSSQITHIFNLTWLNSTENWINLTWLVKNLSLTLKKLNIEIFSIFDFCIILWHYLLIKSHKEKHEDHLIIIIINSYIFVTLIKLTYEELYAICIEWTKLFEIENRLQSIWLLHAVETVSFKTMYQICSCWLHVKEWVF